MNKDKPVVPNQLEFKLLDKIVRLFEAEFARIPQYQLRDDIQTLFNRLHKVRRGGVAQMPSYAKKPKAGQRKVGR